MKNLIAKVSFLKACEKDNYERGCYGGMWMVHDDSFSFSFTSKEDLLQQLAEWVSNHFYVDQDKFLEHVQNECENNRFDYQQNEDLHEEPMKITEDNPDGYLAWYFFRVEVYQPVEFTF